MQHYQVPSAEYSSYISHVISLGLAEDYIAQLRASCSSNSPPPLRAAFDQACRHLSGLVDDLQPVPASVHSLETLGQQNGAPVSDAAVGLAAAMPNTPEEEARILQLTQLINARHGAAKPHNTIQAGKNQLPSSGRYCEQEAHRFPEGDLMSQAKILEFSMWLVDEAVQQNGARYSFSSVGDYLCHLKEVRREQYSQGRITSDVPAPLEIQAVRDLVRARGKEMQLGGLMTACWAMLPEILATVGFMSVRPHSSLCALKAALSMLQGFLYNRYPVAEKTGAGDLGTETDINENVMLVYHRVGTLQSADVVVLAVPEHPKWMLGAEVSDDGRYMMISASEGTQPFNRLWYVDLSQLPQANGALDLAAYDFHKGSKKLPVVKLVDSLEASWVYVANEGTTFTLQTNYKAPRCRIVRVDLSNPGPHCEWQDVVPQHDKVLLEWACALKATMAVSHAMHWLLLSALVSSAAAEGLARIGTSYANAEQALDAFLDQDADFNDITFANFVPIQCGVLARNWIRLVFHDCGTYNKFTRKYGCDGSIQFEINSEHPENPLIFNGSLQFYRSLIDDKTINTDGKMSMADTIVLAGLVGLQRCNLGVTTPFQSGRIDAKAANPPGQLPAPFLEPHVSVVAAFYRMGFNLKEFVALLFGSHSTAFLQSFSSFPLDSTPHQFDNTYCKEMTTANRTANSRFSVPGAGQQGSAGPTPLQSDSDTVADPITRFIVLYYAYNDQALRRDFAKAMNKLSLLGQDQARLMCPPQAEEIQYCQDVSETRSYGTEDITLRLSHWKSEAYVNNKYQSQETVTYFQNLLPKSR
eukprot:jgi/Astpho2/3639/Aster-07842